MHNELDPFDGGCPSDTIPPDPNRPIRPADLTGEIVRPPTDVNRIYAVLSVYSYDNRADLMGSGNYAYASAKKAEWDAKFPNCNHYVVSVPVPAYVQPAK